MTTFTPNAPMLDFLVLSVIAEGDAYGYQISQIIKRAANTKDSALYPVLKRLQENSYVAVYDEQYQACDAFHVFSYVFTGRRRVSG